MIRHDLGDNRPFFQVMVNTDLNLSPTDQALYQQMADALCGYSTVPQDRLNYFSAVSQPPDYQIQSWEGMVNSVQPNGGGCRVTVSVLPDLTSPVGDDTLVFGDYSEIFQVTNGVVQYCGFTDPAGLAGQFPYMDGY